MTCFECVTTPTTRMSSKKELKKFKCAFGKHIAHPAVKIKHLGLACLICARDKGYTASDYIYAKENERYECNAKCKRGCGFEGSQSEMIKHHQSACPKGFTNCPDCGEKVVRETLGTTHKCVKYEYACDGGSNHYYDDVYGHYYAACEEYDEDDYELVVKTQSSLSINEHKQDEVGLKAESDMSNVSVEVAGRMVTVSALKKGEMFKVSIV